MIKTFTVWCLQMSLPSSVSFKSRHRKILFDFWWEKSFIFCFIWTPQMKTHWWFIFTLMTWMYDLMNEMKRGQSSDSASLIKTELFIKEPSSVWIWCVRSVCCFITNISTFFFLSNFFFITGDPDYGLRHNATKRSRYVSLNVIRWRQTARYAVVSVMGYVVIFHRGVFI